MRVCCTTSLSVDDIAWTGLFRHWLDSPIMSIARERSSAASGGEINLNGGITVSGTGSVSLGERQLHRERHAVGHHRRIAHGGYGYVGYFGAGTLRSPAERTTAATTSMSVTIRVGAGTFTIRRDEQLRQLRLLYLGYDVGSSGNYNLSGSGVLFADE